MGGSQIKLSEKESADGKSAERKPKKKVNGDVQREGGCLERNGRQRDCTMGLKRVVKVRGGSAAGDEAEGRRRGRAP